MKRVGRGLLAAAVALTVVATLNAQRGEAPIEWLPGADSLPPNMVTLVVLDEATRAPVEHPLVCMDPGRAWMIGMRDGRLRFGGGSMPDTVRLRILGPLHEQRAVSFSWVEARGRGAVVTLVRRTGGAVDPDC